MSIRIGINGFGRIGRSIFRVIDARDDMQVVAVNDIYHNQALAYLLKYDTVMGVFGRDVGFDDEALYVDGERVEMSAERDPSRIGWERHGVDVVVEATGVFTTRAQLEPHLAGGAPRVVLTVPPKDPIDAMIVLGVNDGELRGEHRLVSNASCTTNCLAPIAKILDDAFGIDVGFMTTVHAYTNDQRLADVPHKDFRRSRAAGENTIPTSTGAARAVGQILPRLAGRLDGLAVRVPVADGSIVDLVVRLKERPDRDAINERVHAAAMADMAGIVEYSTAPLVSSDVIGNPHSSIFDSWLTQTRADGYARVVSWYDNEWGYSQRCADLAARLAALERG